MKLNRIVLGTIASLAAVCAFGQEPKGVHADLLKNLDDTQKKIVSLAETVPADKYTWRPAEGVRSISEVFMHIAGANYMIPAGLGVPPPSGITRDMEKTVTDKAKVVEHLKQSFEHQRKAIAAATDLDKPAKLFGRESTNGATQVLIITHLHEHLGQAIAYARMNKVTPPWSAGRE
jgi:uncharacterized damage-inducible protein DinB